MTNTTTPRDPEDWRTRCMWAGLRDQRLAREASRYDASEVGRDILHSKQRNTFGRRRDRFEASLRIGS